MTHNRAHAPGRVTHDGKCRRPPLPPFGLKTCEQPATGANHMSAKKKAAQMNLHGCPRVGHIWHARPPSSPQLLKAPGWHETVLALRAGDGGLGAHSKISEGKHPHPLVGATRPNIGMWSRIWPFTDRHASAGACIPDFCVADETMLMETAQEACGQARPSHRDCFHRGHIDYCGESAVRWRRESPPCRGGAVCMSPCGRMRCVAL